MKYVKVNVEGYGVFEINSDFIGELLNWLSTKQAVSVRQNNTIREIKNNNFTGRELLEG